MRLVGLSLALLWLIIPSGALVRLTASGLGCPNWPLECSEGDIIPPLDAHAIIEFTNRLFSAVVMLVAVATWIVAWRVPRSEMRYRRSVTLAALGTVAQVPLGGVTVAFDLHPLLVSSHFLLSLATLGFGTLAFLGARDRAAGVSRGPRRPRIGAFAAITAGSLAVALVTGVLVTAAGPHSGDLTVNRRLGNVVDAAYIHVRAAFVFAALAVALAVWLVRGGLVAGPLRWLVAAWIPLIAVQIALGEWQYRHAFPWRVVLVHVSTAGLLWAITVAICARVARDVTPVPVSGGPIGRAQVDRRAAAGSPTVAAPSRNV